MIFNIKHFKKTIKKTTEFNKSIEETITARAKQQLEQALKAKKLVYQKIIDF